MHNPDEVPRLLDGTTVLVTGAGRGIGRGLAQGLAKSGAAVIAVSRTADEVHSLAREIHASGGRAFPVAADIRDRAAMEDAVSRSFDRYGRIDGLVNNAGVIIFNDFCDFSDADWDEIVSTNLTAPYSLIQIVARQWIEHAQLGSVVNITSVESEAVFPRQAIYAASKGGLLQLTKAAALELAPYGIRVNAVGPGIIRTAMTPTDYAEKVSIPLGRLGEPSDIVGPVAFLLSPLSSYITGTIMYVDGGHLLQ